MREIESCDRCNKEYKTLKLFRWKVWSSLRKCHSCGRNFCDECVDHLENRCDSCGHHPIVNRDVVSWGPY